MAKKAPPATPTVKRKSTEPPDVGFRVFTLEDKVSEHEHHDLLWAALLDIGDETILQERITVTETKVTDEKFTITERDYAPVYRIGDATPAYKYIACMATNVSPTVAMYMLCDNADALILRECAVTAETADVLRFVHAGLHKTVSVYMYCPPGCTTCEERRK